MTLSIRPDLQGKVAVVTGGAGVLCSEFCRALAECGAKVAILNRTYGKAEKLAEEIKKNGGEALAVAADVTDTGSLKSVHEKILSTYGRCDILINGAGGNHPMATVDDEYFDPDSLGNPEKKSFFDLEARLKSFLKDLMENPALQDKTVLVSTHGGALCMLLNLIRKRSVAEVWGSGVHKNCAVSLVAMERGETKIIFENRTFYQETVEDW